MMTSPATAGPVMNASAWFVAPIVTARGKNWIGTSVGRSAARDGLSNAVAAATTTTTA